MKFGSFAVDDALACVLAHSVKLKTAHLRKGKVLNAADIALLRDEGVHNIVAAKLDANDVPEDVAAHQISVAIGGANASSQEAFTGRANIHADQAGVLLVDEIRLRAINHLHESLTIATLPRFARVGRRDMLATVKIIPLACPRDVVEKALAIIDGQPLVSIAGFKPLRVGLIITRLAQTKETIIAKSETAIRERIVALGGILEHVVVCDHRQAKLRQQIELMVNVDLILLFGASAIIDRADVVPAALVDAGGIVKHVGMPVDPGNLLMLGALGQVPVIGVPSCARSPKTNGFDWVLERIMAGLEVTPGDIMDMGAGGLLAEIKSRPQPRDTQGADMKAPRIAALILAAGTSTRMGSNKLLADFDGQAMVARTLSQVKASRVDEIVVVTGHQADEIQKALIGHDVSFVHNGQFADGLSTSLRVGVAAFQGRADAILVCLGDMPLIDPGDINRLIAAFNPAEHRSIVVPVHGRRFGNPVLWGAEHFEALMACEGDRGARGLLERSKNDVVEIEVANQGVLLDADTPEALSALKLIVNF